MREDYTDIVTRVAEEPAYYDPQGVPRYKEFSPATERWWARHAKEMALAEVACQECLRAFKVVCISSEWSNRKIVEPGLRELIKGKCPLLYGDPPGHRCDQEYADIKCLAGDSMNAVAIGVLEFWSRDNDNKWKRDPSLEVEFELKDNDLRYRNRWYRRYL